MLLFTQSIDTTCAPVTTNFSFSVLPSVCRYARLILLPPSDNFKDFKEGEGGGGVKEEVVSVYEYSVDRWKVEMLNAISPFISNPFPTEHTPYVSNNHHKEKNGELLFYIAEQHSWVGYT